MREPPHARIFVRSGPRVQLFMPPYPRNVTTYGIAFRDGEVTSSISNELLQDPSLDHDQLREWVANDLAVAYGKMLCGISPT